MDVTLLLLPYDSGREGVRLGAGPGRLVDGGLIARLGDAGHRVGPVRAFRPAGHDFAEVASTFALCRETAVEVAGAVRRGTFPLVVSGNCFAAVGAVSGLEPARLGLVWFDAHGEFNTPDTTSSGYVDGMGLATLAGDCWRTLASQIRGFRAVPAGRIMLLGGRDYDPPESARLAASGMTLIPPGAEFPAAAEAALDRLSRAVDRVYIHIDLDVLDSRQVPANDLASPGGPGVQEVVRVIDAVHSRFEVAGAGLAGYDPSFDPDGVGARAALTLLAAIVPRCPRETGPPREGS